jgi:KTSC domain
MHHQIYPKSNMISVIDYDEENKQLNLTFTKGGVYHFSDFPKDEFNNLINAESVGKYFLAHIKGKYKYDKD